jgi:hypothetical protein
LDYWKQVVVNINQSIWFINAFEKQSQNSRMTLLHDVHFQTYMCSSVSGPETIMAQLSVLISPERELTKRNDKNIYPLVLEEIEMQIHLHIFHQNHFIHLLIIVLLKMNITILIFHKSPIFFNFLN